MVSESSFEGFAISAISGGQEAENKMAADHDRDCGLAVMSGTPWDIHTCHEPSEIPSKSTDFLLSKG